MQIIFLLLITACTGFLIITYSRTLYQIESIRNNQKLIDLQLDHRFKVFKALISTVKNYMNYEQTALKDIVALRHRAQLAKDTGHFKSRMEAENKISLIAANLDMVFELYPDLKTNENCLHLQIEMLNAENMLTFAKESYNDSIEIYHASKLAFPTNLVVHANKDKLDVTFPYWHQVHEKKTLTEELTV